MNRRHACRLLLGLPFATPAVIAGEDEGQLFEQGHEALLRELLEQAMLYDTYNRRCRGHKASTYRENVTRLTVERYGLTASQLVQQLWGISLDAYQRRIDERFLQDMRRLGGCRQAKRAGYRDRLSESYWRLRRKLESLP